MRFMPGRAALPDRRPLHGLDGCRCFGAGPRPGEGRAGGDVTITAYPEQGVRREGDLHSADAQRRYAHRPGPHRARNPAGLLKPAMYGTVELSAGRPARQGAGGARLRGARQRHETGGPGAARRGSLRAARGEARHARRGLCEVLEGVQEGEEVVVRANFLIDAESNLKAALQTFGARRGASRQRQDRRARCAGAEPSSSSTKRCRASTGRR